METSYNYQDECDDYKCIILGFAIRDKVESAIPSMKI